MEKNLVILTIAISIGIILLLSIIYFSLNYKIQGNLSNEVFSKQEVYNEGLKLSIYLSHIKIRKGYTLTINVTLLNMNNTENITFAATHGAIIISIFDKNDDMVYGEIMITPGPTAPLPVFKKGEKISYLSKWDTSKNILNGRNPPSTGKYYLNIEAYVTNLETKSKITLRISKIEVEII